MGMRRSVLGFSTWMLVSSCAFIRPPIIAIATPEVEEIWDEIQGGFRIAQAPTSTPFGGDSPCDTGFSNSDKKTIAIGAWSRHLGEGARKVRVRYTGLDEPLFGILRLCSVYESVRGPWLREYLIRVPPDYVDATTEGRISVVYEPYISSKDGSAYAWILWLSRKPFE